MVYGSHCSGIEGESEAHHTPWSNQKMEYDRLLNITKDIFEATLSFCKLAA